MKRFEPGSTEFCSPFCKYFRCARKALLFKGDRRVCKLTNDDCDPLTCQFASCAINKLLPDGRCGLYIERKAKQKRRERVLDKIRIEDIQDFEEYMKGQGI